MRLTRSISLATLLTTFTLFGACSVNTDGLLFDDDEFAKVSGDGDGGASAGGAMGDGDGDLGGAPGDGDGDGGSPAPDCVMVGELRCDGKQVQVCSGATFIDVGDECEFVCTDGTCGGECVPGTTQCESATTQISCSTAGLWSEPTTCAKACLDDACGGECEPGDRDCGGPSGARRLCDDSAQWTDLGACSTGICEGEGVCSACSVNGETQCTADGELQTCDGSNWDEGVPCPFVCLSEGTAQCGGVCVPESERCGGTGGKVRQYCNASGAWVNGEACPYVCNENGAGGSATSCSGECVPGSKRCNGTTIQGCSNAGLWLDKPVEDCGAQGLVCVPNEKEGPSCKTCVPDTKRCDVKDVEVCSSTGDGWKVSGTCSEKEVCYRGSCATGGTVCGGFQGFVAKGCVDSSNEWFCVKGTFTTQICGKLETCGPIECGTGSIRGG